MKEVVNVRPAGPEHQVLTVKGKGTGRPAMREPCSGCPWRRENAGSFPAEAFRHSANTAEDASMHTFGCHMAGAEAGSVCAGFLLRNSANNLAARIGRMTGQYGEVRDGGADLFASYREMAVGNGVPADDPAIANCRADDE